MNYKNINIKKVFYITCVIVVSCVMASAVIAPITTESNKPVDGNVQEIQTEGRTYVLTSQEDRLVAFVKGADKPYIETTLAVSSLPYDVQAKLKAGIEFDSEQKLRAAINEYCS
ncbi:MAG: hypothetical protein IJD93_06375 [Ruminococcus sp.]|nr:hypothetical protein [Ruminococcus sp.]